MKRAKARARVRYVTRVTSIAFFVDAFPVDAEEAIDVSSMEFQSVCEHDSVEDEVEASRRRGHCSSASPRFLVVAVDRSGLNFLGGHATK